MARKERTQAERHFHELHTTPCLHLCPPPPLSFLFRLSVLVTGPTCVPYTLSLPMDYRTLSKKSSLPHHLISGLFPSAYRCYLSHSELPCHPLPFKVLTFLLLQLCIRKKVKHTEKLREQYNGHLYNYHLDSATGPFFLSVYRNTP